MQFPSKHHLPPKSATTKKKLINRKTHIRDFITEIFMDFSPKKFFDQLQLDDDVFATASKTLLRRRKSLPSFRRERSYSTLPLPRRNRKTTSDSRLTSDPVPEKAQATRQMKNIIMNSATLDRSRSIRRAKVQKII